LTDIGTGDSRGINSLLLTFKGDLGLKAESRKAGTIGHKRAQKNSKKINWNSYFCVLCVSSRQNAIFGVGMREFRAAVS